MSRAAAKRLGSWIEDTVVGSIDALSPADAPNGHFDATVTAPIGVDELAIRGRIQIPVNTLVEIKGAQYRISNGARETAGRFYLKRQAHDYLLERDGFYLLCVHDPDADGLLATQALPANAVDELVTSWSDVHGTRSENQVAKIAWTKVFDPDEITHSDAGGDSE